MIQWVFSSRLGNDILLGFRLYTQFSVAFWNICFSLRPSALIIFVRFWQFFGFLVWGWRTLNGDFYLDMDFINLWHWVGLWLNTVAPIHMWLFKFKFLLIKIEQNDKFNALIAILLSSHMWLIATLIGWCKERKSQKILWLAQV